MTTPTLEGELRIAVHDRDGRCVRRSRYSNRVLFGGRSYVVKSLAGRVSRHGYRIAIGSSGEPTGGDDQNRLFAPLLEQRLSREGPVMIDGSAVFTELFEAPGDWIVAEVGLVFEFFDPTTPVLYNRAVIDPPVRLLFGEALTVSFTVFFDWIGETP